MDVEGIAAETAVAAPKDRAERRRRAFEANLAARLREEAPDLDAAERRRLVGAAGAAFARTRHALDLRGAGRLFGRGAYAVLQAGVGPASEARHPFAERIVARMRPDLARSVRAALARAVARAEISRRHPVDIRCVRRVGRLAFYLTFVAGPDRRRADLRVGSDRRAPQTRLGLALLFAIALALAALGLGMIFATFWAFGGLMLDEAGRSALAQLFLSTLEAAGR